VRGYKEKGNINTPLELAMNNQIDRFNLVIDVIDRVPGLGSRAAHVKERMKEAILSNRAYAHTHGMDAPHVTGWRWNADTSETITNNTNDNAVEASA
jgi:xylulose-5-phosphate/fructose-6-phosphate phosphoketolase